jgi:hypothetical protein
VGEKPGLSQGPPSWWGCGVLSGAPGPAAEEGGARAVEMEEEGRQRRLPSPSFLPTEVALVALALVLLQPCRSGARDLSRGGAGQRCQGHAAPLAAAGQGIATLTLAQQLLPDQLLHQPGLLFLSPPRCLGDRGLPGVLHL